MGRDARQPGSRRVAGMPVVVDGERKKEGGGWESRCLTRHTTPGTRTRCLFGLIDDPQISTRYVAPRTRSLPFLARYARGGAACPRRSTLDPHSQARMCSPAASCVLLSCKSHPESIGLRRMCPSESELATEVHPCDIAQASTIGRRAGCAVSNWCRTIRIGLPLAGGCVPSAQYQLNE